MRLSVSASLVVAVTTVYFVIPTDAQSMTTLTRLTSGNIDPGSTVVFNCISSAASVLMYAPPIINETGPLTVFQTDSFGRCTGIRNAGISGKLIDDDNTTTLLATLVLYVPRRFDVENVTVFCTASDGGGNEQPVTATFTVDANGENDGNGTSSDAIDLMLIVNDEKQDESLTPIELQPGDYNITAVANNYTKTKIYTVPLCNVLCIVLIVICVLLLLVLSAAIVCIIYLKCKEGSCRDESPNEPTKQELEKY